MNRVRLFALPLLIAALLFSVVIDARGGPPVIPSSFYGEIHITDNPPSAGDLVEAYLSGYVDPVASAPITSYNDGLAYNIHVPGRDIEENIPGGVEDEPVRFVIAGRTVATGVWRSGTHVQLDFHPPAANAGVGYLARLNEPVQLSASATDGSAGAFAYAWDLDQDGVYDDAVIRNPSHVFSTVGAHSVAVQVTDAQGGQGTAAAVVVVADFLGLSGQIYDGEPKPVAVSGIEPPYTGTLTYDGLPAAPVSAGSYAVVLTVMNGADEMGSLSATLVIDRRPASVTPAAAGKIYGETDPALTGLLAGFITADPVTAIYTRAAGEDAGGYAISAALSPQSALANYEITYHPAVFTIQPKLITITPSAGQGKVYGEDDPILTYTASETGVLFTGALGRAAGQEAGSYAVSLGALSAGSNYTLTLAAAAFVITPRPITVTADNLSKAFGANDPVLTYRITAGSLAYSDTLASILTGALARVAGESVGEYAILQGNLAANANYTLTFLPGLFTITHLTHTISLVPGWNLVSFNLRPTSLAVEDVLASIAGNYDLVYAWDASGAHPETGNWLKYDNLPQTPDTLTTLDASMGFWIHMLSADTLQITGAYTPTTEIPLRTTASGWNLVGFPSASAAALPTALSDHGASSFTLVYAYHANHPSEPWLLYDRTGPAFSNDLTALTPGWGYWVKVNQSETWNLPY